ncbi:receptor-like protein EIX2 [Dioscorea cayenensis subsp. rotundata]|uniref:Receptor-like protein EIX2 n=1 Tax=Dioscorea cayennensis subsp. rotundata TaxID=55577 RepID=A0AB40C7X9_DIOCR|nr:receptor-like protein EIX2 [Dioscorea cayenensis subsp. rotundata]
MPSNGITGPLPESMGKLLSLRELGLSQNNINGTFPKGMGNLCKLQIIDFFSNFISGGIDDLIDGLSKCRENKDGSVSESSEGLRTLILGNNKLNGTVPENIGQLSKLRALHLFSNSFMSVLTESHFANLVNLTHLDLSYNSLQLNAPVFLLGLKLRHNWMTLLIRCWNFRFEGPLPEFHPTSMLVIYLNDNLFSGSIPSYFADATFIQIFSLSDNHINGSIPSFFCNLTDLKLLDVSNNNMSGRLPRCWNPTSTLKIIDLSDNNFIGEIPDGLVSLTDLRSLHLRNNGFSGNLPLSLQMANNLVILDIGENKLSGNIPTWIGENLSSLIVLRLRSNYFEGIIPEQLSKLSSLQILDLADNNLSGCIPHSFGDFKAIVVTNHNESLPFSFHEAFYPDYRWASSPENFVHSESLLINAKGLQMEYSKILSLVTSIDLSNNKLSCELPEELTKLHGLHFLNLSYNHFNGKIPESISDMKQLESLDLSENNLFGTIPSAMSTLNFLSHLNLSHNILSGKIPSGGQLQTFNPSAYNWNLNLCGSPLQKCTTDQTHYSQSANEEEGESDWLEMLWLYVGLAMGFIIGFWMTIGTIMIKQAIRIAYFRSIDKAYDFLYVKIVVYSRRLKSTFSKSN